MGQLAEQLTRMNGVQSPGGQQQFYPSPGAAGIAMARQAAQTAQPATADVGGDLSNPQAPTYNQPQAPQPQMVKPSFLQAATSGPQGMPNAMSPGLSKGGKLAVLLTSGLKGALAGRAASEQTVAQTGGRRSGGVGMGFQAGLAQPFQEAEMGQDLQQKQAQTQLTRAQGDTVNVPGVGPMPAWLAKSIAPASIQAGAKRDVQGMKGDTAESIQGQKSETQQQIHRFMPVPGVGMFDTQTRQVMPGTASGITITPEIAQDHNLPEQFIGKPMKLSDLSAMSRVENQGTTTVQGQSGPALVNKKTAKVTPLGLGNPGMGRPMEVGDADNPGQTKVVTGGTAVASGAPGKGSASVTAPKKALESFTSGGYSQKLNSIATAREHMKTFNDLAGKLDNGDTQALNALGNAIHVQFGDDAVTNFNIAKQFFSGEVGQAVTSGGGTGGERGQLADDIASKSSWKQLAGALKTADALLSGKQKALNETFEKGMQGQPNFGANQKMQPKKPAQGGGRILVEGKDF